jgi:hypothetical protein
MIESPSPEMGEGWGGGSCSAKSQRLKLLARHYNRSCQDCQVFVLMRPFAVGKQSCRKLWCRP